MAQRVRRVRGRSVVVEVEGAGRGAVAGRAIVYARVSTTGQAASGLSIEAQTATARAAAQAHGWHEVEVVVDAGISGATLAARPGLLRALDDLAAGRAGALYVARLDRLSRSMADVFRVADLAHAQGWRLWVGDVALDTATAEGSTSLALLALFAQFERQRIADRHRAWHAADEARGRRWGVDVGPRSRIAPEVRARVMAARAGGATYRAIADDLNRDGVPTARGRAWTTSAVVSLLRQRTTWEAQPTAA